MFDTLKEKVVAGLSTVRWRPLTLTLLLGSLGGFLFDILGLPLAWMLGAMTATGLASMIGASLQVPRGLRDPWITILGVMLGSGFSADTLRRLVEWIPSILALPIYVIALSLVGRLYLRHVAGFEARTAYFSSAPGGLAEMILLGDYFGGDMRKIALLHSTRVFLVVIFLPFILSLFVPGLLGETATELAKPSLQELVVLAACAIAGYWIAQKAGLPAPQMFGPMILSAVAHLTEVVEAAPPVILVAVAQVVMGSSLGARFSGIATHEVLRAILVGCGLTLILLSMSAALAWSISQVTDMPFIVLLIAFSPGGVAEMGLVALAIGADPTFVASIHILRIALVVVLAPALFKYLYATELNAQKQKEARKTPPS